MLNVTLTLSGLPVGTESSNGGGAARTYTLAIADTVLVTAARVDILTQRYVEIAV